MDRGLLHRHGKHASHGQQPGHRQLLDPGPKPGGRYGSSSEEYLRELLHFPQRLRLEAILSLGMPAATPAPHSLEELKTEKVHEEAMDAHLLVNVRYTLKPGTRGRILKKFEEIGAAPCSRKEPGNLRYDVFLPRG